MDERRSDYKAFRTRLDAVLRERDPQRLRDFLVAEGQWPEDTQTDTEAALWMMIATSKALADQHEEAKQWLLTHGHEAEARAIFGERRNPGKNISRGGAKGNNKTTGNKQQVQRQQHSGPPSSSHPRSPSHSQNPRHNTHHR